MTGLWLASYVALWLLVMFMAVVLLSTLRNLGVLYSTLAASGGFSQTSSPKPSNLNIGDILPDVALLDSSGKTRHISAFRGSKVAFAIVSPSCGSCSNYLELLKHDHPVDPLDKELRDFVVVGLGDVERTLHLLEQSGLGKDGALFDPEGEIGRKWGIATTPGTVIVNEDMMVVRQIFGVHELMALRNEGRR